MMSSSILLIKKKTKKKKPKVVEPTIEVVMEEKDMPSAPATLEDEMPDDFFEREPGLKGASKADAAVRARIMKLLNVGFHEKSNEQEAKNSMKLAQKLMRRHNLSQALMIKEHEEKNSGEKKGASLKGGMVKVKIMNRRTGKASLFHQWLSVLLNAVNKAFETACFNTVSRGVKCDVTIYGIYTNAQLAAYAFKTAAERISKMQAEYQPDQQRGYSTATSRFWYAKGIADGLKDEVERSKKEAEVALNRKLKRAKAAESKGEAYEESDDDDDGDVGDVESSLFDDFQSGTQENNGGVGIELSGSQFQKRYEDAKTKVNEVEKEKEAAIILADQNTKVQEDVINKWKEETGRKIYAGRKRKAPSVYDGSAFRKGQEDAKQIDLKQRAIGEDYAKKVKREKM
jgi:Protein of unknown function (DUF2786)